VISQIKPYIRQKNVPLKNALIIVFLIFSTIASATDYYISSAGNDTNNGLSSTTPWKTIAKVNSSFSIMKPGDRILFNRGDSFYGTITVTKPGSAGNPITIGAYGTGTGPIITGFTTISGWTNETGGIYSKTISCQSNPNLLVINGKEYAMGRYPKAGTDAIYTSHSTNVSITDANLNSAVTNWTGAEVVIRKNEYEMDRCVITNHVSQTLTYTDTYGSDNATDGYYYFIQNDIRTLTQYGEWYYNGTKLYVYFGAVDPTTKTVQLPTLDRLFYASSSYGYITIDGLSFNGANSEALYFYGADYGTVQNCYINFAGKNGIWMESANSLINNNTINYVNQDGILNLRNTTITNNTIKKVNVIEGIAGPAEFTNGINNGAGNCLIQYNKIDSVGANGIHFGGNNSSVKNNVISNFALIMNDKGGINTDGWTPYTGEVIDGNIIFNGLGKVGKASYGPAANGIYLDSYASGITVTNNSIYNNNGMGMFLSNAKNITLQHNTCYNNYEAEMYFLEWSANTISGITMTDNIFFAKAAGQLAMKIQVNVGILGNNIMADRNYYARPIDDNLTINTWEAAINGNTWQLRTLANWQSYTGKDANSHKSPIAITNTNDIRFEYNASKTNKIITLEQPMIDVKSTKYVNSITLLPFTSVVLMVDPNPDQPVIPIYTGSVVENATPSLLEITYNVSLANIVPAASSFSVSVNSVVRTVNAVVISGTKVQSTLASPIVYGDVVTFSYTKPASNPLQTPSGGIATSISNQTVINNCINIAPTVNQPPFVEISNPLKGNKYETNSTITIDVIASDPDGSISKVEFYSGAVKLVELTSAPYTYTWKDVAAGSYFITAIATDNLNATTTSLPVEFEVGTTIKYDADSKIINLYPNPNDGHFSIGFINPLQNERSEILITDLAGKQVYNGYVSKEETIKQIDLSYIKSGIYILMIIYKEILVTKKIIIN
jgi:parallel beta-helix repeat protein